MCAEQNLVLGFGKLHQRVEEFSLSLRVQIEFWLLESRTPSLLREVAAAHPSLARRLSDRRPFLASITGIEDQQAH